MFADRPIKISNVSVMLNESLLLCWPTEKQIMFF